MKMRVAEIGDNCIDVYERIGKKYPTGNVVDTGVNLQKLGIPVSIISTTGNDENGKWMLETLKKEGVDISHLKIGDGATAVTYMDMDGKDRVHGDYVEGVLENIVFDEEDIDGVLIATLFTDSVVRLSRELDARDIPYVYVDSNIVGEHQLAYFGTESYDAGFIAAKLLMSQLGSHSDILISRIVHSGKNDSNQGKNRREGFCQYLTEQGFEGNIHEVKLRIDDTDYNFARLDEIFRANPRIEGAVIFNSTCYILGNYLKERGLENVKLVGYDLIGKNTQLLSEGIITALIAQRPEQQGYDGIKSLCNYLVLKQRPDKVNLMPIDILIKENLKYYLNKKL